MCTTCDEITIPVGPQGTQGPIGPTGPAGLNGWLLNGNSESSQKYFGTNNNYSIPLYTNNVGRGIIDTNGNFGFGTSSIGTDTRVFIKGVDSTINNSALKIVNSSNTVLSIFKNDGTIILGTAFTIKDNYASTTGVFDLSGSSGGSFQAESLFSRGSISLGGSVLFNLSGFSRIYGDGSYGIIYESTLSNKLHSFNGNIDVTTTDTSTPYIFRLTSTTKGFLPPRMTTGQKNAISSPTAGLVVYDTTLNKLCVYTTAWETITSV